MGREIEIKIPLTDEQYDKIFSFVSGKEKISGVELCTTQDVPCPLEHVIKSDTYFSRYNTREESKAAGEPQVIRIRREKTAEPKVPRNNETNEKINERSFFCIKRKSVENGIELNREDETYVEKPEVVQDLLLFSGYHQFFEKNKDSYGVYCKSEVLPGCEFHLELEKVNGLKYIEVEVTDGSDSADSVRAALEKFMEKFGLDTSKRDSRSWMEILRGAV